MVEVEELQGLVGAGTFVGERLAGNRQQPGTVFHIAFHSPAGDKQHPHQQSGKNQAAGKALSVHRPLRAAQCQGAGGKGQTAGTGEFRMQTA